MHAEVHLCGPVRTAIGATIAAGLPITTPAMTVERVCGSGLQTVIGAAHEIQSGARHCIVARGMENMDQAPYLAPDGRWGYSRGRCGAHRQHASRRIERRLLGQALRMAQGDVTSHRIARGRAPREVFVTHGEPASADEAPDQAASPGRMTLRPVAS